ncbi:MAG: metalloregulator ArsR/SmtB family transcription factor [Thermomicrobiales bacterium]
MGQLIVGRPAPMQLFAVSAPLELTSAISLTFRAAGAAESDVADPGFDRWLIDAWRSLDAGLRHDLDLLLGFSGRLLYYIEELLFAFEALGPDRLDASFDEYFGFLESLPASTFPEMAANALVRIYRDRGLNELPPTTDNASEWRMFLRPGITRANIDEAAALVTSPDQLKQRTLALLDGFWRQCYQPEFERNQPDLERAVRFAQALSHPSVQVTFQELTGHRLPPEIDSCFDEVERVVFCPSSHVGSFIQYILYPPALILYFNPASVLRNRPVQTRVARQDDAPLETPDVLDGLRAMSDPSRMRIIEMLREKELYAQEIVARLGISQSAVSRHLSTLESADLVTVRPSNGMKFYAIDRVRLRALSSHIESLAEIGSR